MGGRQRLEKDSAPARNAVCWGTRQRELLSEPVVVLGNTRSFDFVRLTPHVAQDDNWASRYRPSGYNNGQTQSAESHPSARSALGSGTRRGKCGTQAQGWAGRKKNPMMQADVESHPSAKRAVGWGPRHPALKVSSFTVSKLLRSTSALITSGKSELLPIGTYQHTSGRQDAGATRGRGRPRHTRKSKSARRSGLHLITCSRRRVALRSFAPLDRRGRLHPSTRKPRALGAPVSVPTCGVVGYHKSEEEADKCVRPTR